MSIQPLRFQRSMALKRKRRNACELTAQGLMMVLFGALLLSPIAQVVDAAASATTEDPLKFTLATERIAFWRDIGPFTQKTLNSTRQPSEEALAFYKFNVMPNFS